LGKCFPISRKNRHLGAQAEMTIHVAKALYQPATEKSRAASDEDSLTAHLMPEFSRKRKDKIEIFSRERRGH
jgi:hypothetical protein